MAAVVSRCHGVILEIEGKTIERVFAGVGRLTYAIARTLGERGAEPRENHEGAARGWVEPGLSCCDPWSSLRERVVVLELLQCIVILELLIFAHAINAITDLHWIFGYA